MKILREGKDVRKEINLSSAEKFVYSVFEALETQGFSIPADADLWSSKILNSQTTGVKNFFSPNPVMSYVLSFLLAGPAGEKLNAVFSLQTHYGDDLKSIRKLSVNGVLGSKSVDVTFWW